MICASDPLTFVDAFDIVVGGPRKAFKNRWRHTASDGGAALTATLQEAKALADRDALSPEEEAALIARRQQQQIRAQQKIAEA